MNKNRFLIAGGAGFIGSHLIGELLHKGDEVCVVDNFSSGSVENISHLTSFDTLTIYNQDINNELPNFSNFNFILHLASIANTMDYERNPLNALKVNAEGNMKLLEIARKSQAKYIFFSSSEIYGHHILTNGSDLKEESMCDIQTNTMRSPYFVGKLYGEELVRNFCMKHSMDYLIIRPFNIYGPRMDAKSKYGRVIPNFLKWAKLKEPLIIHGDGNQERSFCFISDFITCLMKILSSNSFRYNLVNIGNPEPVKIKILANLVNKITRNPNSYIYKNKCPNEPYYRTPNIDRVKKWLNWNPSISLEEGLKSMIILDDFNQKEVIKNESICYSSNI